MSDETAQAIIAKLGLAPHPEGGWYGETFRAAQTPGERGTASVIYFLLEPGQRSHWHRVDGAEIWLWHAGSPLLLRMAPGDEGPVGQHRLGPDVLAGEVPQLIIPTHYWQTAQADEGWALVSCVVSPGFTFAGFELAAPGWEPGN